MSNIMSILYHELLDTGEKIQEVARIADEAVSNGFNVEIVLEETKKRHTITPTPGFRPIVLEYFISEFIDKNGIMMCTVQILEDE